MQSPAATRLPSPNLKLGNPVQFSLSAHSQILADCPGRMGPREVDGFDALCFGESPAAEMYAPLPPSAAAADAFELTVEQPIFLVDLLSQAAFL